MTYGFLTYVNGTFFIRRVGEHEYAFTDAVGPCDTEPTVLEMLMCEQGGLGWQTETTCHVRAVWCMSVLLCTLRIANVPSPRNRRMPLCTRCLEPADVMLKQQEEGPWPSAPGTPQAVPAGGAAGASAAGAPGVSGSRYQLRSSAAGAGGASGGRGACSYDRQQQHPMSALEVTDEHLGTGKYGGVVVGRCALEVAYPGHIRLQAAGTRHAAEALPSSLVLL